MHYKDEDELGFENGYTVPNFGKYDADIGDSVANMKEAENTFGNKDWLPDKDQPHLSDEVDKKYNVPNFGMDSDIMGNFNSLAAA